MFRPIQAYERSNRYNKFLENRRFANTLDETPINAHLQDAFQQPPVHHLSGAQSAEREDERAQQRRERVRWRREEFCKLSFTTVFNRPTASAV